MTNFEKIETSRQQGKIDQKIQFLEAKILDQSKEYILEHDEDLRNSFDETVKKIEFSNHLQFIRSRTSDNQKTSPRINYRIDLGGISVPASTKYQLYKRTSGIKMDGGGAEFYVDFAQATFEPLIFEGDGISQEIIQRMQKYCQETRAFIDYSNLTRVEAQVVIKDLYGANHSTDSSVAGKAHLNRPQNLEEVVVEYKLSDKNGNKVKITSRNYYTHASAQPRSENLYNASSPANRVGPVKSEIKKDMVNYWDQLLDLMETQAELNHNNKIDGQLGVIGKFFKPVIGQNSKEDIPSLQTRIGLIAQNTNQNKKGISINDPRRKETVEEFTGSKDGILQQKDILAFLSHLFQKYPVTSGKISAYIAPGQGKESITGDQFDMLWDGMGKFPEQDQQFSMLALRENVTLTIYQSQEGGLYYGGAGGYEQVRDQSGKTQIERKTMELQPEALKIIISETYAQYVCARTGSERTHIDDVNYLISRQNLDLSKQYPNPQEIFKSMLSSESFQSQFQNTYDSDSNNVLKGSTGSVTRIKDKNGQYKLGVNHGGKYVVLSETRSGFRIEENGKTYDLGLSGNDVRAVNGFLYLIEKQIKSISDEYNNNIINRSVKY